MNVKAVIFDMDGLMFDTEKLWINSVKKTNKNNNTKVPIKLIKECVGFRKDIIDQKIKEHMGQDFDTEEFRRLNRLYMNEEINNTGLKKKKGLTKLIRFLQSKNIPMAVASTSKSERVEQRFTQAKFSKKYFKFIVAGDMVEKPKPDPAIYLKTCELLGLKPNEVLALEDSASGVKSASSAGCKTVLIPDIKMPEKEVYDLAYAKLKSLDEVINLFN